MLTTTTNQIPMAIRWRAHLLPRLCLRYLHGGDHVNDNVMVKRYLQQLSPRSVQRLRLHPLQYWPLAPLWMRHFLIPSARVRGVQGEEDHPES